MTLDQARLRDRLRGIVGPALGGPGSSRPGRAEAPAGPRSADNLERALGGSWREHDATRSFVVTRRFDPDTHCGRVSVRQMAARLQSGGCGVALLGGGSARAPFIFLDLETTGLSGGAGTHAFLVGRGWFDEEGGFITEQHLMTDFASERAMLAQVARELAGAGALVTFNGKSFDAPVLETRYLFHRLASPCVNVPHVDVLHPARRFWGAAVEGGCSLTSLEQRLLGSQRIGDVAGMEIPGRYFQFVRTRDALPLAAVFEHNRLDLLSLAGVTAHLLQLIAQGSDAAADHHEACALGRLYERAADFVRAQNAFERAVQLASRHQPFGGHRGGDFRSTHAGVRVEALRCLALIARRQQRFLDAADLWKQVLEVPGCPAHLHREATEALAIHHEHRERDLRQAKRFALLCLENEVGTARGDGLRHRLARIERKLISERPSLFPSSP